MYMQFCVYIYEFPTIRIQLYTFKMKDTHEYVQAKFAISDCAKTTRTCARKIGG